MPDRPQQLEQVDRGSHNLQENLLERLRRVVKAAAKRMLPGQLVNELKRYRAYPRPERALYLRIRISSSMELLKPKFLPSNSKPSLLFVCYGNIMRSPMCEALMKRECAACPDRLTLVSAGLNAVAGRGAHPWAIAAARAFGISLENHRARFLTPALVEQATVIFTMDYQNQVQLLSRYPGTRHKAFLLGAYAGEGNRSAEISDPYHLDEEATLRCYQTLHRCIQNLRYDLAAEWQSNGSQSEESARLTGTGGPEHEPSPEPEPRS
jgi:protein-tyrosine-phosphatase